MKPISDVWRHFKITSFQTGKKQVSCKYCNTKYEFANATRMRKHLTTKCTKIAEDIRATISEHSRDSKTRDVSADCIQQEDQNEDDPVPITNTCSSENKRSSTSENRQSSIALNSFIPLSSTNKLSGRKRQLKLEFADSITLDEQKKIDEAVARAIYATASPLSLLENSHWQAAFKLIRPAYKLPSVFLLSNTLLEVEHVRIENLVNEKINNAKCLCLLSDGWTNCRGEGIINFVITTPEPVFYKAVQPNTNRETSDYIFNEFSQVIDEIGSAKFVALITDNAANMKSAWKKITEKYPHVTAFGCAPHSINLLAKDILKLNSIKIIVNETKLVIKTIKKSHVPFAVFKSKQKDKYGTQYVCLKLPCTTRWSTIHIMINSMLCNKAALLETIIDPKVTVPKPVRNILLDDDNYWAQLKLIEELLKPIAVAIAILESDSATIADVPQALAIMRNRILKVLEDLSLFECYEIEKIEQLLMKRINFCCKPIHVAANLLHPLYRGEVLAESNKITAIEFITEQSRHLNLDTGKVLSNLAEFRTDGGIWSKKDVWNAAMHITPSSWWRGLCTSQPLMPLALRLHEIPASSAACERIWSAYENIHTKRRNRLTCDRVNKLTKVKWNLNLFSGSVENKIVKTPSLEMSQFENEKPILMIDEKDDDYEEMDYEDVEEDESGSQVETDSSDSDRD